MDNQYNYYNPENSQNTYQNLNQPEHTGREKKSKKRMPKAIAVIGLAVLFGVVSSATFLTSNILGSKILGLDTSSSKSEARTATPVTDSLSKSTSVVTSDVSSIVESVMPSVVSITNLSVQQVQNFFGGIQQYEMQSAGTGIIISQTDEELLIVTNNHVIQSSETLTVTFSDESSAEAHVKGSNPEHDVAVIAVRKDEIPAETMKNIAVATLGDSTQLKVGEPAIAIGNALGYGQSVTTGVISALDRVTAAKNQSTGETVGQGIGMIQTDAAINQGNSGGALLNIKGEVIGINSEKLSGSTVEGMGYAIPISDVSDIIDSLMNQKTKYKVAEGSQGYLGITCFDVENAQRYHMPTGVYVYETVEDGPADRAGITKGNIITAVNGSGVDGKDALQKELTYYAVGETVTLTIQVPENNGEYTEKSVDVTLGELESTR